MRLTEEEMWQRRQAIIHTAFRLFCDYGIDNVPLSKIAKKAGFSENTIYRYFGNKEKLVLEAFIVLWDTIMKKVEQIVKSIPHYADLSGYGQMQVWIENFRHLYQIDKEFVLFSYETKLYLLRQNIQFSKSEQNALMRSFRGHCLAALDKGKADGSIPTKESSEDLFYAIWGSIRGYIVKIVVYEKLYGEDDPWESRYDILEKGILCALSSGWSSPD